MSTDQNPEFMAVGARWGQRERSHSACLVVGLFVALFIVGTANGQGMPASKGGGLGDLDLAQLGNVKVKSASLHDEDLQDAPASITLITAEEIRKFGCRTLGEALSHVAGFYVETDHTYTYIGVRGFSLPGDYDSRVIVMIDGHNMADIVFNSAGLFGNDFPLDIDLVDRIEVLRGASSALYGSNGMLATINVITKKPAEVKGTTVRLQTGSLGEREIEANTSIALPRGAKLLFSTSVFNNAGAHELYFNEFDTPQTNFGRAINMDGEKGFHAFADVTWGNWEILAVEGDRVKVEPIPWLDGVFNDSGTRAEDSRGFLDLSYTKDLPGDRALSWQVAYDSYRYRGIYRYHQAEGIADTRERDYGDWLDSKFTYRLPDWPGGHLTLGAETTIELRSWQNLFDAQPQQIQLLSIKKPDRYAGLFAQQEWAWKKHWEFNVGARFDCSWLRPSTLSPRVAVIYKPNPKTDLKMLYSRGFRNPSSYEMFFNDNGLTEMANPSLRPETVESFELDFDQEISKQLRLGASAYHYLVHNLIEQNFTAAGLIEYVNRDKVRAAGASLELAYRLPAGIELVSSLEMQRAVYGSGSPLPNSPGQVGKFHLSMPLWHDRLTVSSGVQAMGQRNTYGGVTLPWMVLPEVVVSTKPLRGGVEFSAGIKNLSNTFYRDPVGLSPTVDSMIGTGRTYYLNLTWHSAAERDNSAQN